MDFGEVGHYVALRKHEGKVTPLVITNCFVVAIQGLLFGMLFGYDLGIIGGLSPMEPYLSKHFPAAYKELTSDHESNYCKYDHKFMGFVVGLQYIVAAISSLLFVPRTLTKLRHNTAMLLGASIFILGKLFDVYASNLPMLFAGRILLGVGLEFINMTVSVYFFEMTPTRFKFVLSNVFHMSITVGIIIANLINFRTAKLEKGWRISSGAGAIPAIALCAAPYLLGDSTYSVVRRGEHDKAKEILQRIHGVDNVDEEFQDLIDTVEEAKKKQAAIIIPKKKKKMDEQKNGPQLLCYMLIQFARQVGGMNVMLYYAPSIFKTVGFPNNASLMSVVLVGGVNVYASVFAIFVVDKIRRRVLYLGGGIIMIISQIVVGSMMAAKIGVGGHGSFTTSEAKLFVYVICAYVAAYSWSWSPLRYLVDREVSSLEVRSSLMPHNNLGNSAMVTYGISQLFLTFVCSLKFGVFFLFAGFSAIVIVSIALLLPETKNVPFEEMDSVWKSHKIWSQAVAVDGGGDPKVAP